VRVETDRAVSLFMDGLIDETALRASLKKLGVLDVDANAQVPGLVAQRETNAANAKKAADRAATAAKVTADALLEQFNDNIIDETTFRARSKQANVPAADVNAAVLAHDAKYTKAAVVADKVDAKAQAAQDRADRKVADDKARDK